MGKARNFDVQIDRLMYKTKQKNYMKMGMP